MLVCYQLEKKKTGNQVFWSRQEGQWAGSVKVSEMSEAEGKEKQMVKGEW
jgi:hypothetical protein